MTTIFVNEGAEKNHAALVGMALPLLPPGGRDRALHVADGGCTPPSCRRDDDLVQLVPGDATLLCRGNGAGIRLQYDPAALGTACAALVAAATQAGMPVAADSETLALLTLAQRLGRSDIPVLVEGPTGTGKEVMARLLHRASARRDGPFVPVNCAAMPEAMLEALLFGHRKGAFTGASEASEGFFRAADGGTLLLDEIGEMPLAPQAKLLRALQEGEVVPLGATRPVAVDVRVIACTNRELPAEVEAGRFREDLYYRLNVFPLRLPALRERRGDIAPLAYAMLLKHGCDEGQVRGFAAGALALLHGHTWPGNVRELENVIRRADLLAGDAQLIEAEHIRFDQPVRAVAADPALLAAAGPAPLPAGDAPSLSDIAFRSEASAILETLRQCGGHRGATARKLGISERTLRYRLSHMREAGLAQAGAGR